VLLVLVITSPYAWLLDQVVLLPPVLQLAALHSSRPSRVTKRAAFVYVLAVVVASGVLPWDVLVCQATTGSSGLLREVLTTPNMLWHVTLAPIVPAGSLI